MLLMLFRSRPILIFSLLLLATGLFLILFNPPPSTPPVVSSFDECAAAGYPILEKYPEECLTPDGRSFTRVTPVESPQPISLSGTYACLPKKDTGGPVTLECAFGLKTSDGYYALDMSSLESKKYPLLTGQESLTVTGSLYSPEYISSDRMLSTYDILGIIIAATIIVN